MNQASDASTRLRDLERSVRRLRSALGLLGMAFLALWITGAAQAGSSDPQHLTVRGLTVVDDQGVARVHIASPVPDPILGGVEGKRRSPSTGMTIHDADGNEVGGFGILDDGTRSIALDDKGGDRIAMVVWPDGTPQLILRGEQHTSRAVLGGFLKKDDYGLALLDADWNIRGEFVVKPDGQAVVETAPPAEPEDR